MWRAGVDLYGDSEIAESYRRGDRLGRLDLHKMMGSPDDAGRAEVYRRGSPVYRAERIEAPRAAHPRPQGQARRPAHDRAHGRGARDRGQAPRGPLVRRGRATAGSVARTGATRSSGSSPSSRRTSSTSRSTRARLDDPDRRSGRPRGLRCRPGTTIAMAPCSCPNFSRASVPFSDGSQAVAARPDAFASSTWRAIACRPAASSAAFVEPVGDVLVGAICRPDARQRVAEEAAESQSYRISSAPSCFGERGRGLPGGGVPVVVGGQADDAGRAAALGSLLLHDRPRMARTRLSGVLRSVARVAYRCVAGAGRVGGRGRDRRASRARSWPRCRRR